MGYNIRTYMLFNRAFSRNNNYEEQKMNREKAIRIIETVFKGENYRYNDSVTHMALDIAIEALQTEPSEQVTGKLKNPCDSLLTEESEDSKEQKRRKINE